MNTQAQPEAVAVIGMDARFPGADDVDAYWDNLLNGVESVRRFAPEELDPSVAANLREAPEYVPARGLLHEADRFDAAFFDVPPREAQVLDPQQRVFMEIAWRALEDAGYAPGTHQHLVGVFAGMTYNTYHAAHVAQHPEVLAGLGDIQTLLASEKDYLATRIAYKFNLRGPCVNIATACSTSLVAICHAFNSLLDYQCDIALAGGISILCPQQRGYLYLDGGIYSPDGHCRPFDAAAQGTVFSNGGGAVVLKRLSQARADGDTIYAIVRGAAMNNDGAGRVSFTAPGVDGQAEVVRMAQAFAGVEADEIDYIEAHGTGTALGDPIEVAALTQAFRPRVQATGICGLGSAKSNIGHLDAAAGVAGFIKTVLALRHGKLPATLHFKRANPELHLEDSPFYIVDRLRDWPERQHPRRAGVSSFGLGGTNAHVVLEAAPEQEQVVTENTPQLLVLSAKSAPALARARDRLRDFLEKPAAAPLADIAWTLQTGRQPFAHRLALVATDHAAALRGLAESGDMAGTADAMPSVAFMFPGQGAQYAGMGETVYATEPVVRETIDRCADAIGDRLPFDLRAVMFGRTDNAAELLDETRYTQPALFALELALARWWMSRGVRPAVLLGHSIGEFAAAALAGVFSLEDAARLVAERGRLMQQQPAGAMLAVRLAEDELVRLLVPGVVLAAANAPELSVVSGADADIRTFAAQLDAANISCSRLRTSHAFHSAMMEPVLAPFAARVADLELSPPAIDIVSTRTGRILAAEEATSPDYWARQLREPVRFHAALLAAAETLRGKTSDGETKPCAFLEVGPGIATSAFATQTFDDDVPVAASFGRRNENGNTDEATALLRAAGRLWTRGVPLDWQALHGGASRRRVRAPTYRFERTRHWLETRKTSETADAAEAKNPEPATAPDTPGLEGELRAMLAKTTGASATGFDANAAFTALGMDSLALTQFGQLLRKRFDVGLRFRQLLNEYNSIAAVVAMLEEKGHGIDAKPAVAEPPANVTPLPLPSAPAASTRRGNDADRARPETTPHARKPTARQQRYLSDLCRRHGWHTSGSKANARTHRKHLVDPYAASDFDPALKEMAYPIVMQSATGSRLRDVDGNSYVDLLGDSGSGLFGHSPRFVTDALKEQLKHGCDIDAPTPLAGKVASLVQAMTACERVAFRATAQEAIAAAVRAARAVTGRERVAVFDDDRDALNGNARLLEYGTREALQYIAEAGERLAAVLVAPVPILHPERHSPEFLRELRAISQRTGSALIFDETVTGFRVHPAGMQGLLDMRADLVAYGNICGGGLPLGILTGSSRFMDSLDGDGNNESRSAANAGTQGVPPCHPLALAAAEAVLLRMRESGANLQRQLAARTAALVAELEAHCAATGAPVRLHRFSSWFAIDIDRDVAYGELLFYRMRTGGVYVQEGKPCFLAVTHGDADLALVSHVFRETLDEMQAAGFFPPAPAARPRIAIATAAPPDARLGRHPDGAPGWFIPDPERPGRYREVRSS